VLLQGVQGITDLITTPGLINLDFADVKSIMSGAGSALMGIGSARGDDRAVAGRRDGRSPARCSRPHRRRARRPAQRSPAAPTSACSRSTRPPSWSPRRADPEANIIFGAVIDDALGDEVRVTVIAAGFDGPRATTSWGTPSLDIGAGGPRQLEREASTVVDVARAPASPPTSTPTAATAPAPAGWPA
jgi:cell division protein FtsZ